MPSIVMRRARRQTAYMPVFEDWLWHSILPFVVYATFLVSGLLLSRAAATALFGIGAGALLLLFIGIHNSWDTVTFIALQQSTPPNDSKPDT